MKQRSLKVRFHLFFRDIYFQKHPSKLKFRLNRRVACIKRTKDLDVTGIFPKFFWNPPKINLKRPNIQIFTKMSQRKSEDDFPNSVAFLITTRNFCPKCRVRPVLTARSTARRLPARAGEGDVIPPGRSLGRAGKGRGDSSFGRVTKPGCSGGVRGSRMFWRATFRCFSRWDLISAAANDGSRGMARRVGPTTC